jgi:hypothetical protein
MRPSYHIKSRDNKKAPFLNFWWYFEKAGFNAMDLLLDISIKYINQLHIDAGQDNYLIRRIKKMGVEEYNEILEKK